MGDANIREASMGITMNLTSMQTSMLHRQTKTYWLQLRHSSQDAQQDTRQSESVADSALVDNVELRQICE